MESPTDAEIEAVKRTHNKLLAALPPGVTMEEYFRKLLVEMLRLPLETTEEDLWKYIEAEGYEKN